MDDFTIPEPLKGRKIFFTGIKGTGMCAMAELLHHAGADVSGSDTSEIFYTDAILKKTGIPYFEEFNPDHISDDIDFMVYSSAYSIETNPELAMAVRKKIPVHEYTQVLGAFSKMHKSCAVAGVHGKTTTTGMTGTILKYLGLPVSVLAGSGISNFDGKSTYSSSSGACEYFVAETCEYKRHFLSFSPDILIVTSIEPDHLDYFMDFDDIFSAFFEFALKLPPKGILLYCSDDPGALKLGEKIRQERKDITALPYGLSAEGNFGIRDIVQREGKTGFMINGFPGVFTIAVPGKHNILNCTVSAAAAALILSSIKAKPLEKIFMEYGGEIAAGAHSFRGSKRRSEVIGEAGGILFMDDYAHHPTAVKTTLAGLRDFYPGRRIVADFMSHTYSRTRALLDDFAGSFNDADILILNRIYASAREKMETGELDNELYNKINSCHGNVLYYPEPLDSLEYLKKNLKEGDLFITMGAGDNWKLGVEIYKFFSQKNNWSSK